MPSANDVGFANDDADANDVCLRAHKGKHRIIATRSGATSYLRSKCIISPQGDTSFDILTVLCYNKTKKGGGDMNKRTPRITSLIFQGAFSLVCILNIILCTIHRQNFDTDFGRKCADIALDLTFILFLFLLIALPTSLLLNIIARFPNDEPQKKRRLWKLWTVLSPAFYVILWFVSLGVFISSTGGV